MFGAYRTLLALAVLVHHLISIPVIGHYAVHGFFILSGYLMTLIMSGSYGYTARGIRLFAINRFLRLYPAYWMILLLTVGMILFWGEDASRTYRESMYLPTTFWEWIQNLTLVFANITPTQVLPRLSPPTWALTIELVFYLLIALGVSKSLRATVLWLAASLTYMLLTHLLGLPYSYRYDMITAGSLPFSIGAMIYHYRGTLCRTLAFLSGPLQISILFFLFVANSFFAAWLLHHQFSETWVNTSYYLNYLINAVLVIALIQGRLPWISKSFDEKLGDFSYPIYLNHWLAGFLAAMLLWGAPVRGFNLRGLIACVLAIVISFVLSWLIIKLIDKPVQNLRQLIKQKARATTTENRSPGAS